MIKIPLAYDEREIPFFRGIFATLALRGNTVLATGGDITGFAPVLDRFNRMQTGNNNVKEFPAQLDGYAFQRAFAVCQRNELVNLVGDTYLVDASNISAAQRVLHSFTPYHRTVLNELASAFKAPSP